MEVLNSCNSIIIVGSLLFHLIAPVATSILAAIVCCHKFRAKLKAAQLAKLSLMLRHIIVCRDISELWEDKLSTGCDIRHFMVLLSCRDLTTLLKELFLSRHKCFVATSILFFLKY